LGLLRNPAGASSLATAALIIVEPVMSFLLAHPLSWSAALLLLDALLWHLAPFKHRAPRVGIRLALFLGFSALIINAGISPLLAPVLPMTQWRNWVRRRWAFSGGCTRHVCSPRSSA